MLSQKPPITPAELNRKGVHVTMHITAYRPSNFISANVFYKLPTYNEWQRATWVRKLNRGNVFVYVIGHGDVLTEEYCRYLAAAWLDRVQPWAFIDLNTMTIERYPEQREDMSAFDDIPQWLKDLAKDCSNGLQ